MSAVEAVVEHGRERGGEPLSPEVEPNLNRPEPGCRLTAGLRRLFKSRGTLNSGAIMPNLNWRFTAEVRRRVKRPLQRLAGVIDRRADVLLTTILRRELLELRQAEDQSAVTLDASRREILAAVKDVGAELRQHDVALAVVKDVGGDLRQQDLVLNALVRELIRLQDLVEELLARQDQIAEGNQTAATIIPMTRTLGLIPEVCLTSGVGIRRLNCSRRTRPIPMRLA